MMLNRLVPSDRREPTTFDKDTQCEVRCKVATSRGRTLCRRTMSYVRLLRLPPQAQADAAFRCWRRQLGSHGGKKADNICDSSTTARNSRHPVRQLAAQYHNICGSQHDCRRFARTSTDRGMSVYGHQADHGVGVEQRDAYIIRSAAILGAQKPYFVTTSSSCRPIHLGGLAARSGTHCTRLFSGGGEGWGPQEMRWQLQSWRGFASASAPPDPKESGKDTIERSNSTGNGTGHRALPGQRVFLGGLLKPSDKEIEPVKDESAQRFKDLQEEYKLYEAARKDPKQTSEQVEQSQTALSQRKAVAMIKRIPGMTWSATKSLVSFLWEIIKNPSSLKDKLLEAQYHLKEFGRHYWLGCKLLWSDIKTARKIVSRMLRGFPMTRRERKQLLRTASDIFRMVPLAAFVLIPFMEFLLPVALRVFPNMLPSTFQDSLKEEEKLKKELRLRMAYAGFLQETVTAMAVKKQTRAEDGDESEATTSELTEFIEKAKMGQITNQDIPKFAKMFKDELTMDNISRSGLVNMCRYMGLTPFGSDNFLRFQLRNKLRAVTQDDQRILWEGVSSLTKQELQEACRERGMRATGLTRQGYVRQLSQWLDLSTKKSVPISLLIMSRAFTLQAPDPARALAQSISAMDDDVVTEVMIEAASSEEQKTAEYRTRKLESLERQNELIEEENRKREEETKARETKKAAEVEQPGIADDQKDSSETAEDKAVNKAIQQAAIAAAANTERTDTSPQVTMREGQKEFVAASDPKATHGKEHVTTEADIVAVRKDMESGDRVVEPKSKPKTPATKLAVKPEVEDVEEATREGTEDGEKETDGEDGGVELTVAELHALESLASPSSVEKEKAQLAMMKAALQESLAEVKEVSKLAENESEAESKLATEARTAADSAEPSPEKEEMLSSTAGEKTPAKPETLLSTASNAEVQSKSDGLGKTLTRESDEGRAAPDDSVADVTTDSGTSEAQEADEAKIDKPAAVDKSVQRVQNKLASMLDRLELEIQSVEKRIGDKLHILDRDEDGMVSAEEIAFVMQHVLTAASTPKEARAIAEEMDTDSDGQISVAELIAWVKKHSEQDAEDVFNQLYQRRQRPGKPPENDD